MPSKGGDASVTTYIRKFTADVQQQLEANQPKRCTNNFTCTSNERIGIHKLRQCTNEVIKPADKGLAVVILSKEEYIKEAELQIHVNNHAHYMQLNADANPRSASFIQYMFVNR